MKEIISKEISKLIPLKESEIFALIEIPPSEELGDFAFPCFVLAKIQKNPPQQIAKELAEKFQKNKNFEKVRSIGAYLNFFINKTELAKKTITQIQKGNFGCSTSGKGKTIVIDMSSPNIAKPFGVGHLRSTIIGNSLAKISEKVGFKVKKINYLGDWGTPFGKIIAGYKKFGNPEKLKKNPIKHLLEVYVKANSDDKMEDEAREWFRKLELGDKEARALWKKFRELSIKEFKKIYKLLNVEFDIWTGESYYNNKMEKTISLLKQKNLLKSSEGAQIVNLEKYNLGVALIKKSDDTTLYTTRDLTAAIDRKSRYKFSRMFYEVGSEQKLHFNQVFKILELLGFSWAKDCVHVEHGLYLDTDGKKFATRKGKTIFMEDIIEETVALAEKEIKKRESLSEKNLSQRALKIALAAIIYGDLKNHRSKDIVFDIKRFLSFEGNTGPYLLYTYARARSILKKTKLPKKYEISSIEQIEKSLITQLNLFSQTIADAYETLSPNIIANYAFHLSQTFNEFYHSCPVLHSENQAFRLFLVDSFSKVLKESLKLLGIDAIERM